MKKNSYLEELKKLALSKPLVPALDDKTYFDKVNKFVTLFNITEGKNKITAGLLYKVFNDWTEQPVKKLTFHKEFGKLFPSDKVNNRTIYRLNYKPGALIKKGKELVDNRIEHKVPQKDE
jgi:hypothetical protein